MIISESDYKETACPCIKPGSSSPISVCRVIEKLDTYLNKKDFDAAQRHLLYWLEEAQQGNDIKGKLTVLNELIGLYRKLGNEGQALEFSDKAVAFAYDSGYEDNIITGTTLINAATAYNAFNQPQKALSLYAQAEKLYHSLLTPDDERLGGLYNNMALAYMKADDFDAAEKYFFKALDIMSAVQNGEGEQAVTYCNLADLVSAKQGIIDGEKQISVYLEKAYELLKTPSLPKDGNLAFICEKCAPVFSYYGYFIYECEISHIAEEIYERN